MFEIIWPGNIVACNACLAEAIFLLATNRENGQKKVT